MLKVFTHIGIDRIPDRYILPRWTQSAVPEENGGPEQQNQQGQQGRGDVLPTEARKQIKLASWSNTFSKIGRQASRSEALGGIVDRHLKAMQTEINQFNKTMRKKAAGQGRLRGDVGSGAGPSLTPAVAAGMPSSTQSSGPPPVARATSATHTMQQPTNGSEVPLPHNPAAPAAGLSRNLLILGNPPRSSTKGPRKQRYPSGLELQPKRSIICGFCGEEGHNISTCKKCLASSALQMGPGI